jgi:hypothetical protein
MVSRRRKSIARVRAVFAWTALFLAAIQAALGVWLYRYHPETVDPEYRGRLARLKARRAEEPSRPLVVVLGSSRPLSGLRAGLLNDPAPGGPVVFNFSQVHTGPVRELILLRRLLAEGVRPDAVVLELFPAFLPQQGWFSEGHAVVVADPCWSDWPVLRRYYHLGEDAFSRLFTKTFFPAVHYRRMLLARVSPFLSTAPEVIAADWAAARRDDLDAFGWQPAPDRAIPAELEKSLQRGRDAAGPSLDGREVSKLSDGPLRELLGECSAQGIRPMVLLMPEHSALRSWYTPAGRERLEGYLASIAAEYGAPVVDARGWLPDEDFLDFCHLVSAGATDFTERFGREALRPWLAGRPLPAEVLLHPAAAPASAAPPRGP